jgi:hypothetical protein
MTIGIPQDRIEDKSSHGETSPQDKCSRDYTYKEREVYYAYHQG